MELFLYAFAAEDGNRSANHWRRTGRGHLTGNNDRGFIAREQYMERGTFDGTDDIVTDLIRHKGSGGYFYRFPTRCTMWWAMATTTPPPSATTR